MVSVLDSRDHRVAAIDEMFAIVPAHGRATPTDAQIKLLRGKAKWINLAHKAGLLAAPTIVITRPAWEALQAERQRGATVLRKAWVATLFKLVTNGAKPPMLVVRTSASRHSVGLMHAHTNIPAPINEADSVDPAKALAKAVSRAFESYDSLHALWRPVEVAGEPEIPIVIVQAQFDTPTVEFATRDPMTGAMGPNEEARAALGALTQSAEQLCLLYDREAGVHMKCLVSDRDGEAVLLSARPLQASADAELEAAVDRVDRGIWSAHEAVLRMEPARLPQLLHPRLAEVRNHQPIATGVGVSPGAASGEIVFTPEDAQRIKARGKHCILVSIDTGPGDIDGMKAATGILTARGGQNSHAAIIARVAGKACVSGLRALQIDLEAMTCTIGNVELKAGDKITIDGNDGLVYKNALPLSQPAIGGALGKLLDWSDASRSIAVRTNVETIDAAKTALSFGAEGIGLARSEHMFFTPERLTALRRLILSQSEEDRKQALKGLVDYQSGDYGALFKVMTGKPVTVRLFDPPLHEFLPRSEEDIAETAASLDLKPQFLQQRLERLSEVNPMLGHRGCRLAITYPEILEMQVRALAAGVRIANPSVGRPLELEIMIPFITSSREVAWMRDRIFAVAEEEGLLGDGRVRMTFGTMIELPRAALRAGNIAPLVDFFSFGTNDLTQTTYGISRDDAPAFLASYQRKGIYEIDPFTSIDVRGVGELISIAIERGRRANKNLKIGICGEHAGDAASVEFFSTLGIDYVSCSPYRVPVARLALAQSERKRSL